MYKKGTNTAQDTFIPRNQQMLVNKLDGGSSSLGINYITSLRGF